MNGPTKEKFERSIKRLVERIIDENQGMIKEVFREAKKTILELLNEIAWNELYEDDAPPMSDEYENEVFCAMEGAFHDNDEKINALISAARG